MRGFGLVLAVLIAFSASATAQAEPPRSKPASPGDWHMAQRMGYSKLAAEWSARLVGSPPGARGVDLLGLGSKRWEF